MKESDLSYMCSLLSSMCGIPVRVYKDGEQVFYKSAVSLCKDPIVTCIKEIMEIKERISYFAADYFYYYGIVNLADTKIVVGPTSQEPDNDQSLRELAFRSDVPADQTEEFLMGMKGILHMPLENMMQMVCAINYVFNGEKISIEEVTTHDARQQKFTQFLLNYDTEEITSHTFKESFQNEPVHNTYIIEQELMNIIRKGDTAALEEWTENVPYIRSGIMAQNKIRQLKNTLIATATLAARASIQGGLECDDAFALSDSYIQECELLQEPSQIVNLQYNMVFDYTERVSRLCYGGKQTKLIADVCNYIDHHITEQISVEEISRELFISRSHLSRRFKEESGESLTDFILNRKTEEAKNLLRYSDRSLSAIAIYLGFSSQSHFSRIFKKYSSMSPKEYRIKSRSKAMP